MTLADLRQTNIQLGAAQVLELLGLSSGEISTRKARDIYGKWFLDAVANRRIRPSRIDNKTNYYRVSEILTLKSKEQEEAFLTINA